MKSRGRLLVLFVSVPIIAFAVVGGFMGKAMAREETYQYLRIFEDVVTLIMNNYVEEVNTDKVMHGAMHGLADGLDPDSAYLDTTQARSYERNESLPPGRTGLQITRQYYLQVVSALDGSPAAKAGLLPEDYIRAIDGQSTRDTSVYEGLRLLAGKPGTKVTLTVLRGNAAEPHTIELVREELAPAPVKGRIVQPGVGYVRVPEFGKAAFLILGRVMRLGLELHPRQSEFIRIELDDVARSQRVALVLVLLRHAYFGKNPICVRCQQPRSNYRFSSIRRCERTVKLRELDDVLHILRHPTPEEIRCAVPRPLQKIPRHKRCVRHLCAAPRAAREGIS